MKTKNANFYTIRVAFYLHTQSRILQLTCDHQVLDVRHQVPNILEAEMNRTHEIFYPMEPRLC